MKIIDWKDMTQRYSKLVGADIYRDGGSLEARFIRCDGRYEKIWLEAADDSPRQHVLVHSVLLIYSDIDRTIPPEEVKKNSETEAEIINALRDFLTRPVVDVPGVEGTSDAEHLKILEDLVYYIPRREPEARIRRSGRA